MASLAQPTGLLAVREVEEGTFCSVQILVESAEEGLDAEEGMETVFCWEAPEANL